MSLRIIQRIGAPVNFTENKTRMSQKPTHIVSNKAFFSDIDERYFSASYWKEKQAITGQAQGRGTSYFFEHEGKQFVLKEYLRGGVIGKLIYNHYLYTQRSQARSIAEFNLLTWMNERGLPVPKAGGAVVVKASLFAYRASLISTKIEHAKDLGTQIRTEPLSEDMWTEIGVTIAKFHNLGVYHADLNCHNILIDEHQKIWLIDFDQGYVREKSEEWQQSNLQRLHRSLLKESQRAGPLSFTVKNWRSLVKGYCDSSEHASSAKA